MPIQFLFINTILNFKGQALVEFSLSSLIIISLLGTGSSLMYMSFIKYFNHVQIYNSVLCVAKQHPLLLCKYNLRRNIKKNLFFGKIKKIDLTKKYKKITAKAKWTVWRWEFKNKLVFNTSSLIKNLPTIQR